MKYKREKTPEYYAWHSMKNRCLNPRVGCFKNYGGRGITICNQWLNSFETFLNDMGFKPHPSKKYSLERIDNNGNYEPMNCVWKLRSEQNLNKRNNTRLTINGITDTITGHAARSGIDRRTISTRLYRGWNLHSLLIKPKYNAKVQTN